MHQMKSDVSILVSFSPSDFIFRLTPPFHIMDIYLFDLKHQVLGFVQSSPILQPLRLPGSGPGRLSRHMEDNVECTLCGWKLKWVCSIYFPPEGWLRLVKSRAESRGLLERCSADLRPVLV